MHRILGMVIGFAASALLCAAIPVNLRYSGVVPTPSGKMDTRYPDGVGGTAEVPLVRETISNQAGKQEGSSFSINVRDFLAEPGSPDATLSAVNISEIAVSASANAAGWACCNSDLLTYSGTGTGSSVIRIRASRSGFDSDSNSFTIQSVAALSASDTTPPAQVIGLAVALNDSNKPVLIWWPSNDPVVSGQPWSGRKEYRIFRNGSLLTSVATTQGLRLTYTDDEIGTATHSATSVSGGAHTMTSGGAGIFGTSDNFLYHRAQVTGDFFASTKVTAQSGDTSEWRSDKL